MSRYHHEKCAYGKQRQHFVSDAMRRPLLRTIPFVLGSEDDLFTEAFLSKAVELMNQPQASGTEGKGPAT